MSVYGLSLLRVAAGIRYDESDIANINVIEQLCDHHYKG